MTVNENNLVWLDLEMTGLDFDKERIIEIATIITDNELNIIEEGPVFAIHQNNELLTQMDEWNTKQHNKSGLVERVRSSETSETEAEQQTLDFIKQYVPEGKTPLCGNSIYVDRSFLRRYMPRLNNFFHYRLIDVSTTKELCKRWYPAAYKGYSKDSQHLALQDIRDSIDELKYYRKHMLKPE